MALNVSAQHASVVKNVSMARGLARNPKPGMQVDLKPSTAQPYGALGFDPN